MMQKSNFMIQGIDRVFFWGQMQLKKNKFRYEKLKKYTSIMEQNTANLDVEHDNLTGVYTRQAFLKYAQVLMQSMPDKKFHLIVSNVKDFKLLNAVYGEKTGNIVLCYLAQTYRSIWKNALIGRNGNDQFLCLIYGDDVFDHDNMEKTVQKIVQNAPVEKLKNKYGIYENLDGMIAVSNACDNCFMAIKSISDDYEQDVAYYTEEMKQQMVRSQMIEWEFEDAIRNKEFHIYYQPKIDTDTEKVIGAEALVRWQRPDGTVIFPSEFISVYEKNGLIERLDEYVFRCVCAFQKSQMEKKCKLIPISVNLSKVSMRSETIVERYTQIIQEHAIPFFSIPIELTESAAMDSVQMRKITEAFVNKGFVLHMDDFGTGYSSLMSLSHLPFTTLKLDKHLIDCIDQEKGQAVVEQIIKLAHMLHMNVIAEGVECKEQVIALKKMKCHEVQGYYYAKPMPEKVFLRHGYECNE